MRTRQPYLYVRRGPDETLPLTTGDVLEGYEAIEAFDSIVFDPELIGDDPGLSWDAHAAATQWEPQLRRDRKTGQGRDIKRLGCRCATSPTIATQYVDSRGVQWFIVGKERIPASFQRNDFSESANRAMPLHVHPNGSPHIEITTCRRCRRNWMLACTTSVVEAVEVVATRGITLR